MSGSGIAGSVVVVVVVVAASLTAFEAPLCVTNTASSILVERALASSGVVWPVDNDEETIEDDSEMVGIHPTVRNMSTGLTVIRPFLTMYLERLLANIVGLGSVDLDLGGWRNHVPM